MDPELSPDQKLFEAAAKDFLDKEYPLDRIRRMDAGAGFDRDWWRRGAELGWTAMLVPEELGGGSVSGEGVRDLALLAEVLGAGVAPGPLLATNTVLAGLVAAHGTGPDHSAAIESLVSGEAVATWAVYEPGRQWAPLEPGLTARPAEGGFRLDGVKDRVEAAGDADLFLVTAATPQGTAQFLVPAATPGVTVERQWSLDLARHHGAVRFDGVRVDEAAMVGRPGAGEVVERQTQVALVIQCAEVCGGLDRVFEMTTQWARDRYTFGRPIASYQALKHRFADMRTWLEACHATTAAAASAVQEGSAGAAEPVSTAKSYVGDRSLAILQDCVQIHGGIGLTWEHDLHLYLRRATSNRSLYGTPQDHRRRLADLASL
ncbi:alkylation response protein AidB-like acyl-CoA dehydrogenase [Thermocatellispora tengchongensis]|uniref:Alkylation response protein AidB-like acyl-CoA dehydrogenase n=1 Tax=Thermocatellispora tengchongensis TaxID=1073253 RepID=A0A840PHS4_9ACTN|nr:acyl-CoA dehydrogenase family protein [Thermocatellispora tengchongensis]MBB5137361.1 alkylation response protein AidB-like acyl-CoA dehydrogenase [Thermocatellispora tengchongensis]